MICLSHHKGILSVQSVVRKRTVYGIDKLDATGKNKRGGGFEGLSVG